MMVLDWLVARAPRRQPFEPAARARAWGATSRLPALPSPVSIRLVPLGGVEEEELDGLAGPLEQAFGWGIEVCPSEPAFRQLDRGANGRLDAPRLIGGLLARFPRDAHKIVGVVDADLGAPCLRGLFGQAQLDGTAAVLSIRRLDETFYGRASDPTRRRQRLVTEVIHEVGHTLGLGHCARTECPMCWSARVEDIDAKGWQWCGACGDKYRAALRRGTPRISGGPPIPSRRG